MSREKTELEKKIKGVRKKMFRAYHTKQNYDELLNISRQLDKLLKELRRLDK
ncbi:hypothetical protein GCM10010954_21970 [Halobacillus andaensis]|uniref:Spo0E like sporulation regulatory protein n=1 Tax=Halobacillus andaensis TaxID=1176239 RepID=A0A917EVX5_HALAA|nr:sulfur transfer protein SufE [Halobacillus andaensis]GGF22764.1 hypothetical protein GCM10010954_21970 [Halobacillus andaensis]